MLHYEVPEGNFPKYSALYQDVLARVQMARSIEDKSSPERKAANASLEEAINNVALQVKNDEKLREQAIFFFCWGFADTIKVSWLFKAFGFRSQVSLLKAIKKLAIQITCPRCEKPYNRAMSDRDQYVSVMKDLHYRRSLEWYICPACKEEEAIRLRKAQEKRQMEREQRYREKQKLFEESLAEVPSMTYQEYIHSYAWKVIRQLAIEKAGKACQNCGARSCPFYVHHINILAILGQEKTTDLLVLCKECHDQMHQRRMQQRTNTSDRYEWNSLFASRKLFFQVLSWYDAIYRS